MKNVKRTNLSFLFSALFVLAATMVLTSCDPSYSEEWVMMNHSGHDVDITLFQTLVPEPANKLADTTVRTREQKLESGDSLVVVFGGLGATNHDQFCFYLRYNYRMDSVRFTFDDGTTRTFYPETDTTWGPYAFGSDSYSYQEKANEGRTFHGAILWARLTYTLTLADYNRCKGE